MKRILVAAVLALSATLAGCTDDAQVASQNLSKAA
ncbi:beta-sandwich lipoprotein, partial [Thauera sp. ZXT1-4]